MVGEMEGKKDGQTAVRLDGMMVFCLVRKKAVKRAALTDGMMDEKMVVTKDSSIAHKLASNLAVEMDEMLVYLKVLLLGEKWAGTTEHDSDSLME